MITIRNLHYSDAPQPTHSPVSEHAAPALEEKNSNSQSNANLNFHSSYLNPQKSPHRDLHALIQYPTQNLCCDLLLLSNDSSQNFYLKIEGNWIYYYNLFSSTVVVKLDDLHFILSLAKGCVKERYFRRSYLS